MPVNGLLAEYDTIEFSVQSAATRTNSGTAPPGGFTNAHTAVIEGYYADSATTNALQLEIEVTDSESGGGVTITVPSGSASDTHGSWAGTKSGAARFRNVKVYGTGSTFYVVVGSIECYIDGALDSTLSGYTASGVRYTPDALPLAPLVFIEGSRGGSGEGGSNVAGAFNSQARTDQTISGGVRWKRGSGDPWESHPVSLPTLNPSGAVVATSTYGDMVEAYSEVYVERLGTTGSYSGNRYTEDQSGSLWLFPDLPRSIARFNTDFKVLARRLEFPQGQSRTATRTGNPGFPDFTPISYSTATEATNYAGTVAVMGASPGGFEAPFSDSVKSPATAGFVREEFSNPGGADFEEVIGTFDYQDLRTTEYPYSVGTLSSHYGSHSNGINRLYNTHANPHWCFLLKTNPWEVDSSAETWGDYWEKVGSQWIAWSSPSITDATRNHLIDHCLEQDKNQPFLDTFVAGERWLGVSRWITKTTTPKTSHTFDSGSASLWSGTDCTLTHGSSLNVNPSASPCEVELDIGSFSVEPFMWPHLADRITADCNPANIADFKVYLEAIDGTRVLLNDNQPGVAKTRPYAQAGKYAGSWAQDFGAGVVTDTGSDDEAEGVSSATMADPERSYAFQLLADRTASKMVYVVEVDDVNVDFTLEYPEFEYTLSSGRKMVYENAHDACIVHPDGPGVRWGEWVNYLPGPGIQNPPTVGGGTYRPTIIDGLCFGRMVLEGVAQTGGSPNLTTELTQLYDTVEGQSVGQVDNGGHAFILPVNGADWSFALVNSCAECPPHGWIPRLDRDADWEETGSPVQKVWVWAQEPDYFVCPETMHLDYSSSRWTSTGTAVAGWKCTRHSHMVDNTETGAKIVVDPDEYATVRPWRGFYGVIGVSVELTSLWNEKTPWGHYHRISTDGTSIRHHRAHYEVPSGGFDQETDVLTGTYARIAYSNGSIFLVTHDGSDTYWAQTDDDGGSYSTLAVLLTGAINSTIAATHDGYLVAAGFKYDSGTSGPGTIIGKRRGPGDSSWSSQFTFTDGSSNIAFSDSSFHFVESGGRLVMVAEKDGDSGPTEFYSTDLGASWTEV